MDAHCPMTTAQKSVDAMKRLYKISPPWNSGFIDDLVQVKHAKTMYLWTVVFLVYWNMLYVLSKQ